MSIRRLVILGTIFLLLAWAGSGAISYAVVEVAGSGPRGEQGPPGPRGEPGPQGPRGLAGAEASQQALKRLGALWATQTVAGHNPGQFIQFSHPQVIACLDYILNGTNSFVQCPGFER